MLDVLKRYLLIVWNFFFGQGPSESIQDSPKDQPAEDIVPPVEVNDEAVKEEDDVDIDILDGEEDDEEEVDEEEEEEEEDEREEADIDQDDIPKKPENKIVVNDVPTKPSNIASKIEDVKVPDVPKTKDAVEIKGTELPKPKSDVTEKSETPKLKPEFEVIEKESPKVVPKVKSDFEVIERGAETQKPDASDLKPEFEIVEREVPKVSPAAIDNKPAAETKGKEAAPKAAEKQVAPASKPHEVVGGGVKEVPEKKEDAPKLPPPPPKSEVKTPEKPAKTNHVKFEDDEVENKGAKDDVVPKPSPKSSPLPDRKPTTTTTLPARDATAANNDFVALEKGANNQTAADVGPLKTDNNPIDAFISGEQKHTGRLLHPESIQDQQL